MDKKEYHRNYYYKRDPEKLKSYRTRYLLRKEYREREKQRKLEYYSKNKDRILEKMNFEYRAKKLHEFVDNILNIPEDNNSYG